MSEEFILFRRDGEGVMYLGRNGHLTSDISNARRFAYHSEAIAVAKINGLKVREL